MQIVVFWKSGDLFSPLVESSFRRPTLSQTHHHTWKLGFGWKRFQLKKIYNLKITLDGKLLDSNWKKITLMRYETSSSSTLTQAHHHPWKEFGIGPLVAEFKIY